MGALSTSIATPDHDATSWKQEVSRRLAAHKSRVGLVPQPAAPDPHQAGSRAAKVAERVAARYAQAPSFSQMLAEEARASVRAAEAASRAALEAQTAAESVLAGLEAGLEAQSHATPASRAVDWSEFPSIEIEEKQLPTIRWEADLPLRRTETAHAQARAVRSDSRIPLERWREPELPGTDPIEVEAAQPIHANLIQFPRELVATRRLRPRLAEGPHAAADEPEKQLSIFEVDPQSISTEPAAALAVAEAPWPAPDWQGIELDEEANEEIAVQPAGAAMQPASLNWRLMAGVVDGALIVAACLAAAMTALNHARVLPGLHQIELGAAVALVLIGVLYHLFFFTAAESTPGMKWARISLCTFDDQIPSRAQRCGRLGALLLSLLPVGLGAAWAIFDEDRLSWHDRLSGTYLRRG